MTPTTNQNLPALQLSHGALVPNQPIYQGILHHFVGYAWIFPFPLIPKRKHLPVLLMLQSDYDYKDLAIIRIF